MGKLICLLIVFCMVGLPVFAKPPEGAGSHAVGVPGKGKGVSSRTERITAKVLDEIEEAVLDEVFGEGSGMGAAGGMPPGLAKKGKMPPGLAKKGKTPPGWSKANFGSGAEVETENKEGLIRGWVRKVFRRGKQ